MKRALSIILILCLVLSFAACSSKNNDTPKQTESAENNSTPQQTESAENNSTPQQTVSAKKISIGQRVTVGELSFTVDKVTWSDEFLNGVTFVPDSGDIFCQIKVTIDNNSRKNISHYSFPSFVLNYDNGYDTHPMRGDWEYGHSSYIVPTISAGDDDTFIFINEIPEVQYKDKSSSMVLEISFNGEDFALVLW